MTFTTQISMSSSLEYQYTYRVHQIKRQLVLMLEYTYSKAIESPTHEPEITISLVDIEACIDSIDVQYSALYL